MNYLQNLGPSAGRNGGPMTVFPVRDSILVSINRKTHFVSSIDLIIYFRFFKHSHLFLHSVYGFSCVSFLFQNLKLFLNPLNKRIYFSYKFGNCSKIQEFFCQIVFFLLSKTLKIHPYSFYRKIVAHFSIFSNKMPKLSKTRRTTYSFS